jgi:hypothetical protein
MSAPLIDCQGVSHGRITLPPFQLKRGDLLCLHRDGPSGCWSQDPLAQILCGTIPLSGLSISARIDYAEPAFMPPNLVSFFYHPRAAKWLQRHGRLPAAEAEAVVRRLDKELEGRIGRSRIGYLPWVARVLLGLEAAWARGTEVLLFDVVGLDPLGRDRVFQAIAARGSRGAAVHFSYEYSSIMEGRQRQCPAQAQCLDVFTPTIKQAG